MSKQKQIFNERTAKEITQAISLKTSDLLEQIRQDIRKNPITDASIEENKNKLTQGIKDILGATLKETLGLDIPNIKLLHMITEDIGAVKGILINAPLNIEPAIADAWLLAAKDCDRF